MEIRCSTRAHTTGRVGLAQTRSTPTFRARSAPNVVEGAFLKKASVSPLLMKMQSIVRAASIESPPISVEAYLELFSSARL